LDIDFRVADNIMTTLTKDFSAYINKKIDIADGTFITAAGQKRIQLIPSIILKKHVSCSKIIL